MIFNTVPLALALSVSVSAAVIQSREESNDPCQVAWRACMAAGTPEIACSCTLTACAGEDNLRNREYCYSATAKLNLPSQTPQLPVPSVTAPPSPFTPIPGIPGGCNPAHPGSCPSSYFDNLSKPVATASVTDCPGTITVTVTATECPGTVTVTVTGTDVPTPTPEPHGPGGAPGGGAPGSGAPGSGSTGSGSPGSGSPGSGSPGSGSPGSGAPGGGAPGGGAPGSNPVVVPGKTWTFANLTRYCGSDNNGCDYNFVITANDKTERCTVVRMPVPNAATESWNRQPCTTGSDILISWGYVAEPAPAFAVITVNIGTELAWFGVPNINAGPVTPHAPFGSGDFGTLPSGPVYTYN